MLKALLIGIGLGRSRPSNTSSCYFHGASKATMPGIDRCSLADDEEENDMEFTEGTSSDWTDSGKMADSENGSGSISEKASSSSEGLTNEQRLKYQLPDSFTHRQMNSGLGWITAALFIIADMAGGGVVAIPMALLKSGLLVGSLSMLLIGTAFCYTAHLLGENWLTMCRRWPQEYGREHCRKPYPEMAYRAMGDRARLFMSCTLNVMLFAVSVVYLLLAAKIISELWASLSPAHSVGPCVTTVLLSIALLPITYLKSPQDFWWAVVTAMLTTTFSVLLILLGTLLDFPMCAPVAEQPAFRPGNYFLCIGIFFFSFGGHGIFPTIQHDMRHPRKFTRSSVVAFIAVASMYVPIAYLGYFVYGDSLQESIISSVQTGIIQQLANFLIALHCVLTLTIVINPFNQELEHLVNVPHHFCWQRVFVRTGVMLAVVLVALTVPNFGPILNLIGGTAVALTAVILPCLFHLYLHATAEESPLSVEGSGKTKVLAFAADQQIPSFMEVIKRTPRGTLALNGAVIVIAILCGMAATNSALIELSTSRFSRPCYLSSSSDSANAIIRPAVQAMHCCGTWRNISRYDKFTCPPFHLSAESTTS